MLSCLHFPLTWVSVASVSSSRHTTPDFMLDGSLWQKKKKESCPTFRKKNADLAREWVFIGHHSATVEGFGHVPHLSLLPMLLSQVGHNAEEHFDVFIHADFVCMLTVLGRAHRLKSRCCDNTMKGRYHMRYIELCSMILHSQLFWKMPTLWDVRVGVGSLGGMVLAPEGELCSACVSCQQIC